MNIQGVRDFRNTAAQLVAASGTHEHQYLVSFSLPWTEEENEYELETIIQTEASNEELVSHELPERQFFAHAVIVISYRPLQPDPTAFDVLELGEICHGNLRRHENEHGYKTQIVDFIIVARDGSWKSVFELADPHGQTLCPGCGYRALYVPPDDEPDEWKLEIWNHHSNCPVVKAKAA